MKKLIHGSLIAKDDIGYLIIGEPNIGKSSLCLELINNGYDLISDDAVYIDGNIGYRPRKIKDNIYIRDKGYFKVKSIYKHIITIVIYINKKIYDNDFISDLPYKIMSIKEIKEALL